MEIGYNARECLDWLYFNWKNTRRVQSLLELTLAWGCSRWLVSVGRLKENSPIVCSHSSIYNHQIQFSIRFIGDELFTLFHLALANIFPRHQKNLQNPKMFPLNRPSNLHRVGKRVPPNIPFCFQQAGKFLSTLEVNCFKLMLAFSAKNCAIQFQREATDPPKGGVFKMFPGYGPPRLQQSNLAPNGTRSS